MVTESRWPGAEVTRPLIGREGEREAPAVARAAFAELWDVLYPQERSRIVQLLVERVVYDSAGVVPVVLSR